jgi:hypothetical protein
MKRKKRKLKLIYMTRSKLHHTCNLNLEKITTQISPFKTILALATGKIVIATLLATKKMLVAPCLQLEKYISYIFACN